MRGVFERPAGSGVWWIHYQIAGKRRREKVGRKSDALKLYQARKASASLGVKLPELRNTRKTTVGDLIDLVLEYTVDHKDRRGYVSKAGIIRQGLGQREAESITPQDLEKWLRFQSKTPATYNRYRAFLSLCWKQGARKSLVSDNPARATIHRKEPSGRYRYLSREEYIRLHSVINARFPEHLAEFIVSVHSGMRLAEQYLCRWGWFDAKKRHLQLPRVVTKNERDRDVQLNSDAMIAVESLRCSGQKMSDPIFPREGEKERFDNRSWFKPCLVEAGIKDYVWHSNRHTFCSWLAEAGASTLEIMNAAGHLSISMSARYSHLSPDRQQSVVDRIASATRMAETV